MSSFDDNISNYESDPEESLHTQLANFFSSGQWERAKGVAGTMLSTQPESSWLHYQMGYILYQLDQYPQSETHLKKSIALSPDFADAYQRLAFLYLAMNRAGAAEDNIRKALSLDPHDDTSWVLFGHLSLHFNNHKQALDCVEQALRINPENLGARDVKIRAQSAGSTKSKESAAEQIRGHEEILEKDPENDVAHSRIGCIYFDELKDYDRAEKHFRQAMALDPEDKNYQQLVIMVLRKKDWILRLLWLPYLPVKMVYKLLELIPDGNLKWKHLLGFLLALPLLLVGKYLIILALVSAVAFFFFFWPLTKVYEYLTIVDIHKKMGKVTFYKGPLKKIHQQSFFARFSIFLLLLSVFWATIYFLFASEKYRSQSIGIFITLCVFAFILILIAAGIGLVISSCKEKANERRNNNYPVPDHE